MIRVLLLALFLALELAAPARAQAATLSCSLSGSAVVNGSKSYTVSDADIQNVLNWAAVAFAQQLPPSPTNGQILVAWVQSWINGTKDAVQRFLTAPATPPPPPNFQ